MCVPYVTYERLRTPDAGLPLLPSRHVPAAVVRRVLRSRRVGAGFSRRGLPGPQPLEGSHHQAHNTTTTTTATAHKQTPNPPTKTILPYQNHGWVSNKPTHIKTRTCMAPFPRSTRGHSLLIHHCNRSPDSVTFILKKICGGEKGYVNRSRAAKQATLLAICCGELPAIYRAIDWCNISQYDCSKSLRNAPVRRVGKPTLPIHTQKNSSHFSAKATLFIFLTISSSNITKGNALLPSICTREEKICSNL